MKKAAPAGRMEADGGNAFCLSRSGRCRASARGGRPRAGGKPRASVWTGGGLGPYIAAGPAQVAQSVEQRTENPRVGGSIPPLGTNFFSSLGTFGCLFYVAKAPRRVARFFKQLRLSAASDCDMVAT